MQALGADPSGNARKWECAQVGTRASGHGCVRVAEAGLKLGRVDRWLDDRVRRDRVWLHGGGGRDHAVNALRVELNVAGPNVQRVPEYAALPLKPLCAYVPLTLLPAAAVPDVRVLSYKRVPVPAKDDVTRRQPARQRHRHLRTWLECTFRVPKYQISKVPKNESTKVPPPCCPGCILGSLRS